MSRLNWRNARLDGKRATSIVDEDEFRGRDAAARWLEKRAKKPANGKSKRTRRTPATGEAA